MLRRILLSIFLGFVFFQIAKAQVNFTLPGNSAPSNINYAEYFIDSDPGFGNATSIPLTSSTDFSVNNYSLNISSIASGVHRLYFRTRDNNGVWSLSNEQTFFKLYADVNIPSNPLFANISRIEYFVDTDPGFGKGVTISITPSNDVTSNNYSLDISAYNPGVHHIYFRSQDVKGNWSETNMQTFFIANVAVQIPSNSLSVNLVKMEYFIDTDPGFGKGKLITITPSMDVSASNVGIDLSGLSNGVHRIYFRSQDANGSWSETNQKTYNILLANVNIPPNPIPGNITKFEYFFDKDPGFGKASTISVPSITDLSNYSFAADISGLKDDSTHTLYVRTFDEWSLTNTQTFVIGTILPVSWISFNAKAINRSVELNWRTAHETNNDHFDVERSSDGEHFSKIGMVKASNSSSTESDYLFADQQPLNGVSYYRLRQVDMDGQSTYSIVINVKMNMELLVKIITNPVHENLVLQISGTGQNALPISLMDVTGKRIKVISAVNGRQQIDVNDISAGVYYLVYQVNGNNISIPFNKQ